MATVHLFRNHQDIACNGLHKIVADYYPVKNNRTKEKGDLLKILFQKNTGMIKFQSYCLQV